MYCHYIGGCIEKWCPLYRVVLYSECPLSEVPLYMYSLFSIVITVSKHLDVQICSTVISVCCSSASITVTVLDVNDHTPQFSSDRYTLSISEETLRNMRFPLLRATDRDSGENGRLTYTANITCQSHD